MLSPLKYACKGYQWEARWWWLRGHVSEILALPGKIHSYMWRAETDWRLRVAGPVCASVALYAIGVHLVIGG